jgi:hypothetical protein
MSSSEIYFSASAQSQPKAVEQIRNRSNSAKSLEYFIATGFGSRSGPNKVTNKLKRTLSSYVFF